MLLQKQADANLMLLLLASLCHILVLTYCYVVKNDIYMVDAISTLELSRTCSIAMLVAYIGCMFFQLMTHRQLFVSQEVRIYTKLVFCLLGANLDI